MKLKLKNIKEFTFKELKIKFKLKQKIFRVTHVVVSAAGYQKS